MGAAAAVAGQNLGAGHPDRADAAVHAAARFGFAGAAIIGFFFLVFPRQLLAIFGMNDPAVVEIGVQLLRVLSVSGLLIAVALTYTGGLQGTGDTKSPLYISIVSQIVVPLGICFRDSAHSDARSDRHLDRDTHRPRHALRPERSAVQPGQMAAHRRRSRGGEMIMSTAMKTVGLAVLLAVVTAAACARAATAARRLSRSAAGRPRDVPPERAESARGGAYRRVS